jgi:hypothetical protein
MISNNRHKKLDLGMVNWKHGMQILRLGIGERLRGSVTLSIETLVLCLSELYIGSI